MEYKYHSEGVRHSVAGYSFEICSGAPFYNTDKERAYINEVYSTCTNISIDYGIMEKAENVFVLCADIGWTDLGTWGSLYEMSEKDENQNVNLKSKTLFYNSRKISLCYLRKVSRDRWPVGVFGS